MTATLKQTIAGKKYESEKDRKKGYMERSHKNTQLNCNGTMLGRLGTGHSDSEAEKSMIGSDG
jgi:hypothetical protein